MRGKCGTLLVSARICTHSYGKRMSLAKNYIEINGSTFFRRAVTGMIQPILDMYQPSSFVMKHIFPYKHRHTNVGWVIEAFGS